MSAKHILTVGASGNRAGCRVCRLMDPPRGLGERADFSTPCQPSAENLAHFEAVERERIAEALANLAHAASVRAILAADQMRKAA